MDLKHLKQLINSKKTKLFSHALTVWEKEWSNNSELIIEALKNSPEELLEKSLELAASYHPRQSAQTILNLLQSDNERKRRLAVQVIVPKMGKSVENALKSLLAEEKNEFVLASAVTAAARFNLDVSYIEPALSHPDLRVRANAVRAAALLGRERLRELLEPKLKDPAFRVQNEALKGLSLLIPESELEALILKRLGNENENVRAATAYLVGDLPLSRKISLLLDSLDDPSDKVKICAVRALVKVNDPIGIRNLLKFYYELPDEALAESIARLISGIETDRFLSHVSIASGPNKASKQIFLRVLSLVTYKDNWEPFLPWIIGALRKSNGKAREKALKIVVQKISYFRHDVENLFGQSRNEVTPAENALIELIRWKSGNSAGLSNLKEMLYSNNLANVQAAIDALKLDNSLIARSCLKEAIDSGIVLAIDSVKNTVTEDSPIRLPEE
ncbi:MAG: hypothetical protein Kow0029_11970 [Candidatus Rifleibacteriota bacterium]